VVDSPIVKANRSEAVVFFFIFIICFSLLNNSRGHIYL
jgi:hypothetical protein